MIGNTPRLHEARWCKPPEADGVELREQLLHCGRVWTGPSPRFQWERVLITVAGGVRGFRAVFWPRKTVVDPAEGGAEWSSTPKWQPCFFPRAFYSAVAFSPSFLSPFWLVCKREEQKKIKTKNWSQPLSPELCSSAAASSMLNKTAKRDLMQPPGVTSHITSGGSERPRTRPKRKAAERNYRLTVVGSIDSLRWAPLLPLSSPLPLSSAMPTDHAPISLASKSLRRHRHGDDTGDDTGDGTPPPS